MSFSPDTIVNTLFILAFFGVVANWGIFAVSYFAFRETQGK